MTSSMDGGVAVLNAWPTLECNPLLQILADKVMMYCNHAMVKL